MAKRGKREFVQVLRLLEVFHREDVLDPIAPALMLSVISVEKPLPPSVTLGPAGRPPPARSFFFEPSVIRDRGHRPP
jgi:hypothetical protein